MLSIKFRSVQNEIFTRPKLLFFTQNIRFSWSYQPQIVDNNIADNPREEQNKF